MTFPVRPLALASCGLLLMACGSSKADPAPVQVRPLLAECVANGTTRQGTPAIGEAAALPWASPEGARACLTGPAADGDGPLFTNAEVQMVDGAAFATATIVDDGATALNALMTACFGRDGTCPSGQVAVAVEGRVVSIATVQAATFEGSMQFAFGNEADAQAFADAVNSGR